MTPIDTLLARAARWFFVRRVIALAVISLALLAVAIVLLRAAQLILPFSLDWSILAIAGAAVVVIAPPVIALARRPSREALARRLDEAAHLRESISTALAVSARPDPWSRATIDHANRAARGIDVRRLFPITVPRLWPTPIAAAIIFAALSFVPSTDLFALTAQAQSEAQREQQLADAKEQVAQAEEAVEDVMSELATDGLSDEALEQLQDLAAEEPAPPDAARDPDQIRLAKVRELTSLRDRIEELSSAPDAEAARQLADAMKDLKTPDPSSPSSSEAMQKLAEAVRAMQDGQMGNASEALRRLAEQLQNASNELTPEQREALARAMSELAEQLAAAADNQQALERALAEAGLDPALADDPEALAEALANQQGSMSQQTRNELQQLAKASQQSSQQLQQFAQAMQQAGQCMSSGDPNAMGQCAGAMSQMASQLSQSEMMQQQLRSLANAQSTLSGQIAKMAGQCSGSGQGTNGGTASQGQSPFSFQKWKFAGAGGGKGGTGAGTTGSGGGDDPNADPNALTRDQSQVRINPDAGAPIIGRMTVDGEFLISEVTQQFTDAARASTKVAAEAIDAQAIPREYHDAVKAYFSRLESTAAAPEPRDDDTPE